MRQKCRCENSCVSKNIRDAKTRYRSSFRRDCNWDLKNLYNFEEFVDCTNFEEGEAVGLPNLLNRIENATTQEIVINYLHNAEKTYNHFCERVNKPMEVRFNVLKCAKSLVISISKGSAYQENLYYEYVRVLTKCIPERYRYEMYTKEYLYENEDKINIPANLSVFMTPGKLRKKMYWKKTNYYKSVSMVGNFKKNPQYSTFTENVISRATETQPNSILSGQYSLFILSSLFIVILGLVMGLSRTRYKSSKFYFILFLIILSLIGQVVVINI